MKKADVKRFILFIYVECWAGKIVMRTHEHRRYPVDLKKTSVDIIENVRY